MQSSLHCKSQPSPPPKHASHQRKSKKGTACQYLSEAQWSQSSHLKASQDENLSRHLYTHPTSFSAFSQQASEPTSWRKLGRHSCIPQMSSLSVHQKNTGQTGALRSCCCKNQSHTKVWGHDLMMIHQIHTRKVSRTHTCKVSRNQLETKVSLKSRHSTEVQWSGVREVCFHTLKHGRPSRPICTRPL